MALTYGEAYRRLETCGQTHVLRFWNRLHAEQRENLLHQIAHLDGDLIRRMQECLRQKTPSAPSTLEPADAIAVTPSLRAEAAPVGEQALRAGEVGVILVAGGQGTRLGYAGPKGCFPIGPLSGASLFEIHAHKILAHERRYGSPIPLYIMTSQENDAATRQFFVRHAFFGLSPERVIFFVQGMWPALDSDGRVILDAPDHIFLSPDGHGGLLSALQATGALEDMARRGLRMLFYFQVDNPLVHVADPVFLGLHRLQDAEMSVKVCEKTDPEEKIGVVVRKEGRPAVIEYTELLPEQKQAREPDGRLRFRLGNVAIHIFSLDFLRRECRTPLPLHLAHKKVPVCRETGETEQPATPNAYKFEKFIFDTLPRAQRSINVLFAREDEFSPVKNATGDDSAETARRDMIRAFARWLEACGVPVPRSPRGEPLHAIEIDPCYADSPEALRARMPASFFLIRDTLFR